MKFIYFNLFILAFNFSFSQKVEFGLQSSYLFSTSNSILGTKQIDVNNSDISISNIRGSLATGLSLGLTTNLKIHENVKLCLGFDVFKGSETLFTDIEIDDTILNIQGSASQQRFSPGFMFHFPTKKISFFAKTSLLLPINTVSEFIETSSTKTENIIYSKTKRNEYFYSLGFQYAVGAELNLNKSFKISLSLESVLLNLAIKTSKILSFTEQNTNQLENLSVYEKDINYHENLNNFSNNSTYNNVVDLSKPKDELSFSQNFSSILIKCSLIYVFKDKVK